MVIFDDQSGVGAPDTPANMRWLIVKLTFYNYLKGYINLGGIFMTREKMNRISELYKKSCAEGLTDAEKAEQKALREEYLRDIRKNFTQTLDSIEFTDNAKQ